MAFGSVATLLIFPLLCATFFDSVTSECDKDYMYKGKEVWNWFKFQKLDSSGRATCAANGAFINGFRRQTVYKDNTTKDGITGLRAMCCRQLYVKRDVGCVHKDWTSQRYKKNVWLLCPKNKYMKGLRRDKGEKISSIIGATCCASDPMEDLTSSNCYDQAAPRNWLRHWVWSRLECKQGYYAVGIYKGGCSQVKCIAKIRCCYSREVNYFGEFRYFSKYRFLP